MSIQKHHHFILNKPFGYLSQFVNNQNKRRNKKLLGELHDFPEGTMSIGRLDEKSEGLLLLTTDGKMSSAITSESAEKEYYVQVDGEISEEAIEIMRKGVNINIHGKFYTTKPCEVEPLKHPPVLGYRPKLREARHGATSWIAVVLTEGKFRQIRKMTAAIGFPTLRLVRVRVGKILIGDLQAGQWKELPELTDALQ